MANFIATYSVRRKGAQGIYLKAPPVLVSDGLDGSSAWDVLWHKEDRNGREIRHVTLYPSDTSMDEIKRIAKETRL